MEPSSKGTATVPCTGEVNRSERSVRRASRPRLCLTRVGRTVHTSLSRGWKAGRGKMRSRRYLLSSGIRNVVSMVDQSEEKFRNSLEIVLKNVLNATADPASRATSTDESRQQLAAPPPVHRLAPNTGAYFWIWPHASRTDDSRSLSPSQTHRRPCRSRTRPRWTI